MSDPNRDREIEQAFAAWARGQVGQVDDGEPDEPLTAGVLAGELGLDRAPSRQTAVRPRRVEALTAALALAVVGLSLWIAQLRGTVGDLAAPQLNTPVENLSATPRRASTPPAAVRLAPGGRVFTVVLAPARTGDFPDYALEVASSDGRVVWSGAGLRPNADGLFTATLSRNLLPPGPWRLRIYGLPGPGAGRELLGEYPFELAAP